jgi:hypothetical protein
MRTQFVEWLFLLIFVFSGSSAQLEIPCSEFHPALDFPCLCGLNEVNATKINCDGAVFPDFPVLPYRFYIQEFSQKQAGLQTLGAQVTMLESDFFSSSLTVEQSKLGRLSLESFFARV